MLLMAQRLKQCSGKAALSLVITCFYASHVSISTASDLTAYVPGHCSGKCTPVEINGTQRQDEKIMATPTKITLTEVTGSAVRHIVIKVRVENCTSTPIRWDSNLSFGHRWTVQDAKGNPVQRRPVDRRTLLSRNAKERFVEVRPGESFERELDLSKSIYAFVTARKAVALPNGHSAIVPTAGEEELAYKIPESEAKVRVRLEYGPISDDEADAFAVYFGMRPEECGVVREAIASNEVDVQITR